MSDAWRYCNNLSDPSEAVRRTVAVCVHDLNRAIHGALTESESNPFDVKKSGVTVCGPAWWGAAA